MTRTLEENESKKEKRKRIGYCRLFRYARGKDMCFICVSILCGVLHGVALTVNTLVIAQHLQDMVTYGKERDAKKFIKSFQFFAIVNSFLGVVITLVAYLSTVLINIAAFNQTYRIRIEYLKAAMNQDCAFFDLHQTGDISSKISSDVMKLEDGIAEKLALFVYYQTSFVCSFVTAFIKGWKLALICLINFPIVMILGGLVAMMASRVAKKESDANGAAASVAEEVLGAIRTVYAFSGQRTEQDRYNKNLQKVRKLNIKKGVFNGLGLGIIMFFIFCTYAIALWFGYQLIISEPDNYNTGIILAVFFCLMTGSENFGNSVNLIEVFGAACGAGSNVFHMIDNVPKINTVLNKGIVPDSVGGNIELKDVVFHYPSRPEVQVLNKVSITIKRGQKVAFVGHSGCGKSTIVQLISRNYDVDGGTVLLDGSDVRDLSVCWLRAQIGLVGQEPVLFNNTVRENIRYGRQDASNEEIEQAAKVANAHQFIMKLPKHYETQVGERGSALSGGQKQRIAIARAIVRNPTILLLDEATSALDTASEARVERALDKAAEGRTTIIIAHRLSTIRHADFIYVFKDGTVIEVGNHKDLIDQRGAYYDMVNKQMPINKETKENEEGLQPEAIASKEEEEIEDIMHNTVEEKCSHSSFWNVLKLSSPEWRTILLASLCSLCFGCSIISLAVIFGHFLGVMSNKDPNETLLLVRYYCLSYIFMGVFSAITAFGQAYFYGVAGECLTERLRRQMFVKLLEQEVAFFDDKANSTGALCAKLSREAAEVQGATGHRIGTIVQAVATFALALALSMLFEWRVGIIALTFAPILAYILYKEGRMIGAESFGTTKTMESATKIAVDAVSNIRTVKSLGLEPMILKEYASELEPGLALASYSAHWRGILYGFSKGLFNFVYVAAMLCGVNLIVYEGVNYNLVIMAAQTMVFGVNSATSGFAFAPNVQKGVLAADRIMTLFKRTSKISDPQTPAKRNFRTTGQASYENVKFRYPTRPAIQVLKDLKLDIGRGKTIALVGESGCGKSTIIQLLERYYDPDEGIVALDSIPVKDLPLVDVRRDIGFVQQEPVLFNRTIAENIAYGDNSRMPSMDEIIAVAKEANIHSFVATLPLGYDTNIGSKGTQLSGGQKQRIAIARALLRRPKILLLDEATSALDTESEKVVQAALDAAKAGRTCVTIAHRLSTIRDADVIHVLVGGRVVELGTHEDLMNSRGPYYMLANSGIA